MSVLHLILGISLIILPLFILSGLKKKASFVKPLSLITALISWLLILPSGKLYISSYSTTTKLIIKSGSYPWIHSILMETKEHWGLLLPIIASVAAGLVYSGKVSESKDWWKLLFNLSILIGIIGIIIYIGGRIS
ncbi:hypothetical protein CMI39_02165 [Candidatus Pacearchaeota archaeon]|jgi:hypothetical protein|nr:hypothetical protein [Candidatus Pacearchaeota archaeon]|tara:strand:- start:830 stop:1234 length:405 start_codon:yes stop_codon:yes gene_type:complete